MGTVKMVTTGVPRFLWMSEAIPMPLRSSEYEELRISRHGDLLLRGWHGDEVVLLSDQDLFANGPRRACVLTGEEAPAKAVVIGEEGRLLAELDFEVPAWRRVAEVPRFPNTVGGMCFLNPVSRGAMTLVFWELGVLALDSRLDLRWRQDLEWNHRMIHLDDDQVWFDLMYESEDIPQKIGESPWGYSLSDGREIFDGEAHARNE
jgi:hypothetical protein